MLKAVFTAEDAEENSVLVLRVLRALCGKRF
jgi:hypothetical protein